MKFSKSVLFVALMSRFLMGSNGDNPTPYSFQRAPATPVYKGIFMKEFTVTPKIILKSLQQFYRDFKGGDELLKKAEAYLIFPTIYEAGLIVGGKYGFGALVKDNGIESYYKIYSTSVGLSAGVKKYSLIIVFITKEAFEKFINKEEWKLSFDTYLTFTKWNKGVDVNSLDLRKDTIVIPFNDVGLMADISFEGTVFQKLQ